MFNQCSSSPVPCVFTYTGLSPSVALCRTLCFSYPKNCEFPKILLLNCPLVVAQNARVLVLGCFRLPRRIGWSFSISHCTNRFWLAWMPVPKCLCQNVSLPAPEPTCGSSKPNSSAVAQVPPSYSSAVHTTAQRQVPSQSLRAPTIRSTSHTSTAPLPVSSLSTWVMSTSPAQPS